MGPFARWLHTWNRRDLSLYGWVDDDVAQKSWRVKYKLDWQVVTPLVIGSILLASLVYSWC
jgi:hypothetical protein